jgi:hypothetical protein
VTKTRAIEFVAEVRKIQTMVDGSMNVLLNFGEDCKEQAKVLIDWHGLQVRGMMEVEPTDTLGHIKKTWRET